MKIVHLLTVLLEYVLLYVMFVTQLCPLTKKQTDQLSPRSNKHVVLFSFLHGYQWLIAIRVTHIIEATCAASDISCGGQGNNHISSSHHWIVISIGVHDSNNIVHGNQHNISSLFITTLRCGSFLQSGQYHFPFGICLIFKQSVWNYSIWHCGLSQAIISATPSFGCLQ